MHSPPLWLRHFVDRIARCFLLWQSHSELGCHYYHTATTWELTLFVFREEILGGPDDGRVRPGGFELNLKSVLDQFTSLEEVHWQPLSLEGRDLGVSHLSLLGYVSTDEGLQRVWLRIPAVAPCSMPTLKLSANIVHHEG
ncbi:MAG: hypothetical protein KatS3mg114_0427 [Planctomycetaceae bacterium]|nr:MAG: hypothetical protein KatS3mg114_0427 [Planctomycetaceae bacterium]